MSRSIAAANAERMYANDAASKLLGIEVAVDDPGEAVATIAITPSLVNGFDILHGGVLFALADTAFAFACNGGERVTVAASCSIDFLRPATVGDTLTARASERHRSRRTGVYDVAISNQDGEAVAVFRGRSYTTSRLHGE